MGGTTAKICLIDKAQPQTARAFEVARIYRFLKGSGLPLRIPVIEMVEIGAGGGSIARVDTLGRIVVGPEAPARSRDRLLWARRHRTDRDRRRCGPRPHRSGGLPVARMALDVGRQARGEPNGSVAELALATEQRRSASARW